MPYLKLKACNWGIATVEVIELVNELAGHGLIDAGDVLYYQLLYRTTGANPHDTLFGKAFVLGEAIISLLLKDSANPSAPTLDEIQSVLNRVPMLAEAYSIETRGDDWELSLRAPRRNRSIETSDWSMQDWVLFVDTGSGEFRFISVPGPDFHRVTGAFAFLNGGCTDSDLCRYWGSDTSYFREFVSFFAESGLLETSESPFQSVEVAIDSGIELLCHSALRVRQGREQILIDPVLLQPPPFTQNPTLTARFDKLTSDFPSITAVLISHHHWDHLNLQTLVRIPRHVPLYIPPQTTACSANRPHNPDVMAFLRSLGFETVVPVEWGREYTAGATRFTGLPFYGEWFGPDSWFDGCTFVVDINGKRMMATVDADRDERGDMKSVFHQFTGSGSKPVDYLFFCSTGQQHRCPAFCGSPFTFSNTYGRDLAHRMRYHPDRETVAAWCRILKPQFIMPYAEFIFQSGAPSRPALTLDDSFVSSDYFRSYWGTCLTGGQPWVARWKADLEKLQDDVTPLGVKLVMMAPGELVQA